MEAKDQKRQLQMGKGVVRDAQEAAAQLLDAAIDGPNSPTRERAMWDHFLNDLDPRIKFEAFRLLLSYKYGKPTEKQEVTVDGQNYMVEVPVKLDDEVWAKRFAPVKKDGQA